MPYTIDEIKRTVEPIAKKHDLRAVWLFGSYARGEATDSSDVDLVIDLTGSPLSGFAVCGVYDEFSNAFATGADCISEGLLHQSPFDEESARFKAEVLKERVKIYASAQ